MTARDLETETSPVVVEDGNELRSCVIPLLASPQGGVAASLKNVAKPPKLTQTGWFSLCSQSENHPGLAISGCFAAFWSLGHPSLR